MFVKKQRELSNGFELARYNDLQKITWDLFTTILNTQHNVTEIHNFIVLQYQRFIPQNKFHIIFGSHNWDPDLAWADLGPLGRVFYEPFSIEPYNVLLIAGSTRAIMNWVHLPEQVRTRRILTF